MKTMSSICAGIALVAAFAVAMPAMAESARDKRARKEAEMPQCYKRLGTISVQEPDRNWWSEYRLGSPEALIRVFVMRSNCFTLVDRGKGLAAVERERALASGGELQQGSNIGKGQIKAADYVLVPDLVSQNTDASGNAIGAALGSWVGGHAGAAIGGINLRTKTADVLLTITDVRSTEQLAMEEGHADKTDLSWGLGGGGWGRWGFAAAGAYGYDNTEIGQVITLAYLNAYTKLVRHMGGLLPDNASAANVEQAVTLTKSARMYVKSSGTGKVVRMLDPGTMLYPTGNKEGAMWEVKDELGNLGWVSSMAFELAK
ncbi:MAG: CsgG/HfaB family protein [Alphaproteobacteria bacterium]